jgi:ADP-ribose pyrophosphatase YjhB (NUDIX family)
MRRTSKKEIELLVRAIIRIKGKILVCKKIGRRYYFFPGGHVDFGESTKEASAREMKEELRLSIKRPVFIGGSEHLFTEEGKKHHEINLAFWVPVKKIDTKSKEDHLRFFLFDRKQLAKENILPRVLKKAVLKWLKDRKPFWVSQI